MRVCRRGEQNHKHSKPHKHSKTHKHTQAHTSTQAQATHKHGTYLTNKLGGNGESEWGGDEDFSAVRLRGQREGREKKPL